MKPKLVQLLAALLALARTPPEEADSTTAQKGRIEQLQDEIETMHGDSEFADAEVKELISDLTEVCSAATPDPDHAEVPEEPEPAAPAAEEAPPEPEPEPEPQAKRKITPSARRR